MHVVIFILAMALAGREPAFGAVEGVMIQDQELIQM